MYVNEINNLVDESCPQNRLICSDGEGIAASHRGFSKMTKKVDDGFTSRVLLSLVCDLADAKEMVQRMEVCILALAREHGVTIPAELAS